MTKIIDALGSLGMPPLPSQNSDTIATLLWARELMQKHLTATYSVQDSKGIEELKPIKIGGVDQWLHIRGRNRKNPVMLYIHGGPGSPMIGFMDAIQRPWEDYFTIVHWDQRQTGKSYYPADDKNHPLSLEQFIGDTEEVIQYLRRYLEQDKLFVLGHSWGSVLGMHIVKRHPEWLYAYVGLGQFVCFVDNHRVMYERLLGHAREQNEKELVSQLEDLIPMLCQASPAREKFAVDNGEFVRKELSRLAGETLVHHLYWDDFIENWNFSRTISPHLTLTDLSNTIFGDEIAYYRYPYHLLKDYYQVDLPKDIGSSFDVPIFFFSGRYDFQVPVTLSDEWFSEIKAPHKMLIHFEESSHIIVNEEPGKLLISLVNQVLPFSESTTNNS